MAGFTCASLVVGSLQGPSADAARRWRMILEVRIAWRTRCNLCDNKGISILIGFEGRVVDSLGEGDADELLEGPNPRKWFCEFL